MTTELSVGDRVGIPGKCYYEVVVRVHDRYVELRIPMKGGTTESVFLCVDKLVFNPRHSLWEPIHDGVTVHLTLPDHPERNS